MSECEREMSDPFLGILISHDFPCVLEGAALAAAIKEKGEIEGCGLEIVRIHIVAPNQPCHFFFKFRPGQQSYKARGDLEKLGFSVRQTLGERALSFYAVKSVVETKGWAE